MEEGGGVSSGGGGGGEHARRLVAAARAGDVQRVRALLAGGAPFAADWLGTGPLHAAAMGDHVDCIGVLLRAGVSRDARTKVERTPLQLAAGAGHSAAVAALLAAGADLHAQDMLRMTALHWAAQRGHAPVIRLLLAHGADTHGRNKFGLTARQLAVRAQHQHVVRLLDDHDETAHTHHQQNTHTDTQQVPDEAPAPPAPPEPTAPPPSPPGAEVLRRHGITLLPHDDSPTVLRAINSGRTLVLSDAGKLLLKQSWARRGSAGGGGGGEGTRGVVVRARGGSGGRVFTLRGSAAAAAGGANVTLTVRPRRKLIHPKHVQLEPVQLQLVMETDDASDVTAHDTHQDNTNQQQLNEEAEALLSELAAARASETEIQAQLHAAQERVRRAEAALLAHGIPVPTADNSTD